MAKGLALGAGLPLLGVNHLEGHIYSAWVYNDGDTPAPEPQFPLMALLVSGGHTELNLMEAHLSYKRLGATQDDAAGEAFDKVARLLGLPYPGGPIIGQKADAFRDNNNQEPKSNNQTNKFPRPMINSDDFNFSFSGLKTAVLYYVKKHEAEIKNEQF